MFSFSFLVTFKKKKNVTTYNMIWLHFHPRNWKKGKKCIDEISCPSYRLQEVWSNCRWSPQIVSGDCTLSHIFVTFRKAFERFPFGVSWFSKKNKKNKNKYKPSWGPTHLSIISSAGQFGKLLSAQMRRLVINRQVFPSRPHTVESLDAN